MNKSATLRANATWESLMRAHSVLMKQFAAENIWHELSMREYDVLYTLTKCDGAGLRITELGQYVLLSQPALSRMIDRLVARGLLAREVDPQDRRSVLVSLTDAGRAAQRQVGRSHGRSVAQAITGALSASEQEQLLSLCRKLTHATSPELGDSDD